ncbi:MAG: hypothetical protein PHE89_05555 [Alphaproteobacteria bacterium]|nr:hypothetical protein [Alphaproteobacteria bacterium]
MGRMYEPFENAEEVWFWFCSSLISQEDGWRAMGDYGGKERCCEINDIYRIIKRLKLCHETSNRHLRVALKWGKELTPPYYAKRAKRSEVRIWGEFITALETALKKKGII